MFQIKEQNGEITQELISPFWKKKGPVIKYEFQELGVEMAEKIKNPWFLFHKYPLVKIREAWKVCQKREIYTIGFIQGVIKRIK